MPGTEVARYRGTVQRVSRITTEATTVAGVDLPKGAVVRLLLSAANRDSRKFANGETFDIDRDSSGHLGFANGMHKCLGAPLAKLETRRPDAVRRARASQFALAFSGGKERSWAAERYSVGRSPVCLRKKRPKYASS
ncbi:cytochrome P450 [Paraburkholderia sp. BR13439]|uniref:cytochrome P450 n=1 Tax=Paraburkholderia TaxID=1822464 RepID=UPI0034CF8D6F